MRLARIGADENFYAIVLRPGRGAVFRYARCACRGSNTPRRGLVVPQHSGFCFFLLPSFQLLKWKSEKTGALRQAASLVRVDYDGRCGAVDFLHWGLGQEAGCQE